MEDAQVISGLLEKREKLLQKVKTLRKQAMKHKGEVAQIDAAIALFATDLTAAKRKASRFARSEHFGIGELTRRCQEGMRGATEPVAAGDLALRAMRDKGLDPTDTATLADFCQRFIWTLNRMLAHGKVEKIGRGPDARWAVPTDASDICS
jgi:L-aminopeptidase/D-esterase-like protein